MDHLTAMLDALTQLQAHQAQLQAQYEAAQQAAMPADIQAALAQVDATFQPQLDGLALELDQLTARVKEAVLAYGASVKGTGLHAVYSPGRVSWDDQFLQGYAATYEEILQARIEGKPSVSLKKVR